MAEQANERGILFQGYVQRMRLEPGDTVVFTTDKYLSAGDVERITQQIARVLPEQKILVLDRGIGACAVVGEDGGHE